MEKYRPYLILFLINIAVFVISAIGLNYMFYQKWYVYDEGIYMVSFLIFLAVIAIMRAIYRSEPFPSVVLSMLIVNAGVTVYLSFYYRYVGLFYVSVLVLVVFSVLVFLKFRTSNFWLEASKDKETLILSFVLFTYLLISGYKPYQFDYVKYSDNLETKSMVVDFTCSHCRQELKELKGKYNLKLAVISRSPENSLPNVYFECSKDKKRALENLLAGKVEIEPIIRCNIYAAGKKLKENFVTAIRNGIRKIPAEIK